MDFVLFLSKPRSSGRGGSFLRGSCFDPLCSYLWKICIVPSSIPPAGSEEKLTQAQSSTSTYRNAVCSPAFAIDLCKMLLIAAETLNSLQVKSVQAVDRTVVWYYDLLFKNMPSQTKNCQ